MKNNKLFAAIVAIAIVVLLLRIYLALLHP